MKFQLFKIDTIGDAYIIIGWLHSVSGDESQQLNESSHNKDENDAQNIALKLVVPLKVVADGWRAIAKKSRCLSSKWIKRMWWSRRNFFLFQNKVHDDSETSTFRRCQGHKASEMSNAHKYASNVRVFPARLSTRAYVWVQNDEKVDDDIENKSHHVMSILFLMGFVALYRVCSTGLSTRAYVRVQDDEKVDGDIDDKGSLMI